MCVLVGVLLFNFLVWFGVVCRMFYFFFESRNSKKDPVVIWLTGGPGCSSELALFYENGPFSIEKNMSLVWNEYGWDKVMLLMLDLSQMIISITLFHIMKLLPRTLFYSKFMRFFLFCWFPDLW